MVTSQAPSTHDPKPRSQYSILMAAAHSITRGRGGSRLAPESGLWKCTIAIVPVAILGNNEFCQQLASTKWFRHIVVVPLKSEGLCRAVRSIVIALDQGQSREMPIVKMI